MLFKHVLCFARIMSTLCPKLCRQTARIGGATAPPAPPSRTPMLTAPPDPSWKRLGYTPIRRIGVNSPAFGGTVPHFHKMSRGPRNQQMSRIFRKWYYFFRCRLDPILHVCLATQQSDELRIKIGKDRFRIRTPTGH